jgi:leader peptidase (prepilin peptidase) / N-methyltransferase
MLRILGTIFAALLGLAFGSFLNVCLSRWPEGESIVHPRSHCRACGRTLAWWENIPLLSWVMLRGRCRTCGAWIGVRYPLVEALVATVWGTLIWYSGDDLFHPDAQSATYWLAVAVTACSLGFLWLLIALAVLDAEHLWLPDWLTIPTSISGFLVYALSLMVALLVGASGATLNEVLRALGWRVVEIFAAAALILLIRWVYWLVRRREGLGIGDAKLLAMLAAWLGLPLALLSLFLGVVVGAVFAVALLVVRPRVSGGTWAGAKLPLGTFLCIGGIVSALWGQQILAGYLRWAGF